MTHSGRANWRKSELADLAGNRNAAGEGNQHPFNPQADGLRSQLPARQPSVNPLNRRELHIRESFIYTRALYIKFYSIRLIRRPPGLRSQLPARQPSVNPLNRRELHIRESFIYTRALYIKFYSIRLIRRPPGLRSQLPARQPSVNPLNLRELHI